MARDRCECRCCRSAAGRAAESDGRAHELALENLALRLQVALLIQRVDRLEGERRRLQPADETMEERQ